MFLKRVKIKKIHADCGNEVGPITKQDLPEDYKGDFRFYGDIDNPYYCAHCKTYVFKRFSINKSSEKIKEAGR
jgi:hypothetical protein